MQVEDYLNLAALFAVSSAPDIRNFRLGAVGERNDGVRVFARNGSGIVPTPDAHAEARILRKLDVDATVYVARILRNNQWALAKPCQPCQKRLAAKGVSRVYYTIAPGEYGCLILRKSQYWPKS